MGKYGYENVYTSDGYHNLKDINGRLVFKDNMIHIEEYNNHFKITNVSNKYNISTIYGKIIFKKWFETLINKVTRFIGRLDNKYYIMDISGECLIESKNEIIDCNEHYYAYRVKKYNRIFISDYKNRIVGTIKKCSHKINFFQRTDIKYVYNVENYTKHTIIDFHGKKLLENRYNSVKIEGDFLICSVSGYIDIYEFSTLKFLHSVEHSVSHRTVISYGKRDNILYLSDLHNGYNYSIDINGNKLEVPDYFKNKIIHSDNYCYYPISKSTNIIDNLYSAFILDNGILQPCAFYKNRFVRSSTHTYFINLHYKIRLLS